jgi:oligoribonuclease NrnB/cAMP/cGMP phosphodiesterase (DHH superfamily)
MSTICIYHGNCADGFGAAWVVRKALRDIEFHAGVYQNPPPDVTGKQVILVDFSYKRAVMEQIRRQAVGRVLVLDHHKTAEAELVDLEGVETVFDMNRSGARIAWDYFFPGSEPPQLLLHIEDRDLWRFNLPFTREIQANVFSYPYDFDAWDELMSRPVEELITAGSAIERKHFKDINELLGVVTRPMRIGGFEINCANLPYTLTSDAGHELAKGKPFGACYWDTPEGRVFSLRSTDEGEDVSTIAKQYGGGGHRNASGFRVSYEQAKAFEVLT